MQIIDNNVKEAMLQSLATSIMKDVDENNPNNFLFTDSDGVLLAKVPFDKAEVSNGVMLFSRHGNYKIGGAVEAETGNPVSLFRIDSTDASSNTITVLRGTVGTVLDMNADIKFNNINWSILDTVLLNNIKIVLESVCLHQ